MSHDLPEFVYLVTSRTEWPVSALADDNPGITAGRVDREVARRRESGNVLSPGDLKVWRARLTDVVEVDLMPETVVRASLRTRDAGAPS